MKIRLAGVIALLLTSAASLSAAAMPTYTVRTCESLAMVKLADTTISSAEVVAGPSFTPPGARDPLNGLPSFCRVAGVTTPAVNFEVWLPLQDWNSKFQGVGNGGMAGTISYGGMAAALRRGYAVASTDTGHGINRAFDATWALGHPELIADFGYRGLHVTTVNAKNLTRAFYAKAPEHSYYAGCSKGGQQGLMEAQRYPEDYDGIVAGNPANNWTRFYAGGHLGVALATLKDPDSYIPPGKVSLIAQAVNAQCDAMDGVEDGVLNDPRQCKFNPSVLMCKPGQNAHDCLSAKQVNAVRSIQEGVRDSFGRLIYPGLLPGGEDGAGGWAQWVTGAAPFAATHFVAADSFFKYMVFEDPKWDFRTFDYDKDVTFALEKVGSMLDSTDTNLRRFRERGGKMIMYHGYSDPDISPLNSINYYEGVVSSSGVPAVRALQHTQEFARLFMVPGMQHCGGGPGADRFDALSALEQWVEEGVAPARITASHVSEGVVDRTRPLCPYPQTAQYKGAGSTNLAENFECVTPGK